MRLLTAGMAWPSVSTMTGRVLLVSPTRHLQGGAALSIYELAKALAADGRWTPVVTVPARGSFSDTLAADALGCRVIATPRWTSWTEQQYRTGNLARNLLRRSRSLASVLVRIPAWVRCIAAVRPDVVVTGNAATPVAALGAMLARTPHVWWLQEFMTRDHSVQFALGEETSQRLIGLLSRRVIAYSPAVARHFSPPIPAAKTQVLDFAIAPPAADENRISNTFRLLLLGHQAPSKGSELAIRALAATASVPRPTLRLVGSIDDSYRQQLEELSEQLGVADAVEFVPFTTDPGRELSRCNALLMCSRDEAFGRVTAEALKAGRPVIGSRSGGTPEIVSEGEDGLLFEPGDLASLSAAIDQLVGDPELCGRLSLCARERNRDRYTLEGMVDGFVSVFDEVSKTAHRRSTK